MAAKGIRGGQLKLLSEDKVKRIHHATLDVLNDVGLDGRVWTVSPRVYPLVTWTALTEREGRVALRRSTGLRLSRSWCL